MVCVSRSRLGRGGLTQFFTYHFFAIQNKRSFLIRKKQPEMGQAPASQSRPRDRPPTALNLGSEDSQLSGAYALQVWWRSASFEARNHGSGRFFLCRQLNRNDPSLPTALLAGFSTMKGNTRILFRFLISGTIKVGLRNKTNRTTVVSLQGEEILPLRADWIWRVDITYRTHHP